MMPKIWIKFERKPLYHMTCTCTMLNAVQSHKHIYSYDREFWSNPVLNYSNEWKSMLSKMIGTTDQFIILIHVAHFVAVEIMMFNNV